MFSIFSPIKRGKKIRVHLRKSAAATIFDIPEIERAPARPMMTQNDQKVTL
jgi:hypothetical protein